MKRQIGTVLAVVLLLTVLLGGAGPTGAQSGAPTVVSYQGQVTVGGAAYTGAGYFKFAVVDQVGTTTYWSNDGTSVGGSEPTNAVQLGVSNGLFSVLLGDTTLANMTALLASAFDGTERTLRVWFSSDGVAFTQLAPDRRIAAAPYALQAEDVKNAWRLAGNAGTTPATHFVGTTDAQPLVFRTNNIEYMRLDTSGRLGLGAPPGTQRLTIRGMGSLSDWIQFQDASGVNQWHLNYSGGGLNLVESGVSENRLFLQDGGNVGIGTNDPQARLDVAGSIRASSQLVSTVGVGTAPLAVASTTRVDNLNADLLDGYHASDLLQRYANVVVVAKSGGDYDTITAALNSITAASDANRYLVKVMPGVYSERVTMKPYVDIEGAGELTTRITYTGSPADTTGTLVGANDAEVRFLTVANTGGDNYAFAIYNDTASPRLTHVTAVASGGATTSGVFNSASSPTMTDVTASGSGGTNNNGVCNYFFSSPTMTGGTASGSGGSFSYGVYNNSSSPTMTGLTATGSGGANNYGVYNDNSSSPMMTHVTANASGGGGTHNHGVYNTESSPMIQNSVIRASGGNSYGIFNFAFSGSYTVRVNNCQITGSTRTILNDTKFTILIGASLLDGGPVYNPGGGVCTCAGVYDESYIFYASTCP
jgi:hypothetical protein